MTDYARQPVILAVATSKIPFGTLFLGVFSTPTKTHHIIQEDPHG